MTRKQSSGFGPGGRATSRRAAAAFTFVEVLLATLVLGTMLVTATTALSTAVETQDQLVGTPITAYGLAREIHSLALLLPREVRDGLPAPSGADVAVLEDLDEASFHPPIRADKSEMSEASSWTQDVMVQSVQLASPNVLAADPTARDTLLRLTVEVLQNDEVRGTYIWWMNP